MTKSKEYELGVLFVHGIGEQPKGDTLLRFGEPIIQWIERLQGYKPDKDSDTKRLKLTKVGEEEILTSVSATPKGNSSKNKNKSILFKESWWAAKFHAPALFDLVWWLLLVGTWITIYDTRQALKSCDKPWFIRIIKILKFLLYVILAFLYQAPLLVVWFLAIVPLTPWRDFLARSIISKLKTIGDPYVLLHNPLQYAHAESTIIKNIVELGKKCEKVMIVAHSQGAALTYRTLQKIKDHLKTNEGATIIELKNIQFVSVGSGIKKLEALEKLNDFITGQSTSKKKWIHTFLFFLPIIPLVIAILTLLVCVFSVNWSAPLIVFFLLLGLLIWAIYYSITPILGSNQEPTNGKREIAWLDLYATNDPVSNGSTSLEDLPPGNKVLKKPDSREIVNKRSWLYDHTTYFINWIDFIPRIVDQMSIFTYKPEGKPLSWLDTNKIKLKIKKLQKARRCRTGLFKASNSVNLFAALGYLLYYFLYSSDGAKSRLIDKLNVLSHWADYIYGPIISLLTKLLNFTPEILRKESEHLDPVNVKTTIVVFSVFLVIYVLLKWSETVVEKTSRHLLFNDVPKSEIFIIFIQSLGICLPLLWIYVFETASFGIFIIAYIVIALISTCVFLCVIGRSSPRKAPSPDGQATP